MKQKHLIRGKLRPFRKLIFDIGVANSERAVVGIRASVRTFRLFILANTFVWEGKWPVFIQVMTPVPWRSQVLGCSIIQLARFVSNVSKYWTSALLYCFALRCCLAKPRLWRSFVPCPDSGQSKNWFAEIRQPKFSDLCCSTLDTILHPVKRNARWACAGLPSLFVHLSRPLEIHLRRNLPFHLST